MDAQDRIYLHQDTIKQLQRALAALDIARDILTAGIPAHTAGMGRHESAIGHVVNAKNTIADMQDVLLAGLPEGPREWVVQGSRIGADHLRNRKG
jgi:hypothetical protein